MNQQVAKSSEGDAKSRAHRMGPAEAKRAAYLSLPTLDVQQRYTIPEASLYLRQCVARTYEQIRIGRLRLIKDGNRSYIHGAEIARASAQPEAA